MVKDSRLENIYKWEKVEFWLGANILSLSIADENSKCSIYSDMDLPLPLIFDTCFLLVGVEPVYVTVTFEWLP